MRAIFISYRRDDTEGYAGRLFRDLRDRFGKDAVFMDVAGIEPGRDFRRVIEDQVASCGVLLAVIGKAWLTTVDEHGKRRLDDPNDFVRLETASALKRDIPVIPVLVQQTEMLREEQLPDGLKDLAFRNSVELTHARWESDVELLIAALQRYVEPQPVSAAVAPPASTSAATAGRRQAWVIAPLATLALGGVAYVAWDRLGSSSDAERDKAPEEARVAAASAVAGPVAQPPAPASAPSAAPAAVTVSASPAPPPPAPASASAPAVLPGPAPARAEATATQQAVASPAASTAPTRRPASPAIAKAPVASVASAAAPRPPMPAAPKPALTTAVAPSARSPYPEAPAVASPAPPAPVTTAAAVPAPAPEVVPAHRDRSLELLGMPGAASTVTRTIVIKPDMSYVNVMWGDVVRFEAGDKSFIWTFNGTRSSFDLAQIAPEVLNRKVTAYVAPNPSFRRR